MTSAPRESEVISLRTSREFKDRLRDWADARGLPMSKLLEEMGELYARAEAGAERKLSVIELLLRPHFAALEREMSRAFEESEGKGNLFRGEAETLRAAAERAEARQKEEKTAWEVERQSLKERAEAMERNLMNEREKREASDRQAREATDTARALTTALTEARAKAEELQGQLVTLPVLRNERDALSAETHRLAMALDSAQLALERVQEDLLREKEALKRSEETHRRELQALEREFAARLSKVELEAERTLLQKTTELTRQFPGDATHKGESRP